MYIKTLKLPQIHTGAQPIWNTAKKWEATLLFILLLVVWYAAPGWMRLADQTMGYIDQSIWLLILLGLITFMLSTGLCWWLLQRFWSLTGLPSLSTMVLQFNSLLLWQQLLFYWASFALLLLTVTGSISAIC